MASFACLRVLTPSALSHRADLPGLVNKFAAAFLERRWAFPRRFELLGPCTFLLIEPRGGPLDHDQLRDMAIDLQLRLFGAEGDGEVTLVAFEGVAAEVARFAALSAEELDGILEGAAYRPPFVGRLSRITADEVVGVPMVDAEEDASPPPPRRRATSAVEPTFFGVYFTPRRQFVGSAVMARDDCFNIQEGACPTDDQSARDFDVRAVTAVRRALEMLPGRAGLLFTPICYAALIHRAERGRRAEILDALPEDRRQQLAAVVYDTPRQPSYSAMPVLRDFLRQYFSNIDLQVCDPDFSVESLPMGAVNSVTFVLPDTDTATRVAAIRRFSRRRDAFKARRVWPAITNVRTHAELEFCCASGVPFVTGRAVSAPLERPPSLPNLALEALPLRAA
ncbi:hypothetical protein ACO2Q3_16770 [Caulobacter sp. KR2-114]|uniref:hypothetical protein n=1 Tax=Caulobacter sp. KR2-114 TaxID=3400912 RepID=UPI003C1068AA